MNDAKIPEYTTVTEAARALGMDRKTVKKRIDNIEVAFTEGLNQFYPTKNVLRNCFIKATDQEKSDLNLTQEKARYFKNLADKVEIENEKLTDRLLDADQMLIEISKNRLQVKEKLMNLSYTLASKIPRIDDQQKAFNLLQNKFQEVLEGLAGGEDLELINSNKSKNNE